MYGEEGSGLKLLSLRAYPENFFSRLFNYLPDSFAVDVSCQNGRASFMCGGISVYSFFIVHFILDAREGCLHIFYISCSIFHI